MAVADLTSNVWAFLLWANKTRGLILDGWAGVQRFSATDPVGFCQAVADFAQLAPGLSPVLRHRGDREALVLLPGDGNRHSFSRDDLYAGQPLPGLEPDILALILRPWPRQALARLLADTLLFQDIRADDRMLVAGNPGWPALDALAEGATVLLYGGATDRLAQVAAAEQASVLVAPANWITDAPSWAEAVTLRSIVFTDAVGAAAALGRMRGWLRPDITLLARDGDTVWGNPLQTNDAEPQPGPALFVPVPA